MIGGGYAYLIKKAIKLIEITKNDGMRQAIDFFD